MEGDYVVKLTLASFVVSRLRVFALARLIWIHLGRRRGDLKSRL
jgi:hypothetical protein